MRAGRWLAAAGAAAVMALGAVPARAQDRVSLAPYVQGIRYGGDWRMRFENFDRTGPGTFDRRRYRYRLRLGAETMLPHNLSLGLRLASGTGEQASTNQTLDNLSAQKSIWVDNAYVKWMPQVSPDASSFLMTGRMPNPVWRLTSSDLIFDDDYAPEGFAQGGEWLVAGGRLTLFATALQAIADEDSKTTKGQWLLSEQLGLEARLPANSRMRVAGAFHRWVRETRDDFGQSVVQDGNRRKPGATAGSVGTTLANRFGTAEVTGQLSTWIAGRPIALQATYARNVRADLDPAEDQGYQAGIIVGRAKTAKSWEAAWFRKRAEADVTVADVADSDFGDGGTNRLGNIFWLAFNPEEWMQAKVKFFATETLNEDLIPATGAAAVGRKDIHRIQADISLKF